MHFTIGTCYSTERPPAQTGGQRCPQSICHLLSEMEGNVKQCSRAMKFKGKMSAPRNRGCIFHIAASHQMAKTECRIKFITNKFKKILSSESVTRILEMPYSHSFFLISI